MDEKQLSEIEAAAVKMIAFGFGLTPEVDDSIKISEFTFKDDGIPEVTLNFPHGSLIITVKARWQPSENA